MNNILGFFFRSIFRIPALRHTFFGVREKVFRRFMLFKGWRKRFNVRNLVIEANMSDWIPQNLYFYNEYEEKELQFVEQFLENGDTFIDIGANIGLFSLVASKAVGADGKVIAFEPYKPTFEDLARNIALNKATNITAVQQAIGRRSETITLYSNESHNDPGMVSADNMSTHYNYSHSQTCEAIRLDEYVKENNIRSIKLIKIDIEGYEGAALDGMRNTLEQYKPTLLIEILDGLHIAEHNVTLIDEMLRPLGYKRYYLNNTGKLTDEKMKSDTTGNVVYKAD